MRACTLSILVLAAMASRLAADVVTFTDVTDTMSWTSSSSRISEFVPCRGGAFTERCFVSITPPTATAIVTGISPTPFDVSGQGSNLVIAIGERPSGNVSDAIEFDLNGFVPGTLGVSFASDADGAFNQPCSFFGGCPIIEDGTVQTGATITWTDQTNGATFTDIVQFQSDIDEVPEPCSLVLLATLVIVVPMIRRRF